MPSLNPPDNIKQYLEAGEEVLYVGKESKISLMLRELAFPATLFVILSIVSAIDNYLGVLGLTIKDSFIFSVSIFICFHLFLDVLSEPLIFILTNKKFIPDYNAYDSGCTGKHNFVTLEDLRTNLRIYVFFGKKFFLLSNGIRNFIVKTTLFQSVGIGIIFPEYQDEIEDHLNILLNR